jgi:hypothetical protein
MPAEDVDQPESDGVHDQPPIRCDECRAALEADSRQGISFLLLDHLTIPLVGCDRHLEQFLSICGVTTTDTVDLLEHHPAGGIRCPGCRLAPYSAAQPMITLQDGAVAVLACPDHQSAIVERFHTGLQTRQQLSTDLDSTTHSPTGTPER